MARSGYEWLTKKTGPEPLLHRGKTKYPEHLRASRVYSHFLSGYGEQDIAVFFRIPLDEVKRDIQHI